MPKNTEIYGWDDNKAEEKQIADMGMKTMRNVGKTTEAESSTGESVSKARDLESDLTPAKP
jgi:hypothetical protein